MWSSHPTKQQTLWESEVPMEVVQKVLSAYSHASHPSDLLAGIASRETQPKGLMTVKSDIFAVCEVPC